MAAAPLLLQTDLPDPRSIDGWEIASLSAVSDAIVWQYPHPRRMAFAARFPIIAMTLLLGALVYRWATDLFGPPAGLMALFLLTFDPNIIAHGSLVTTDMAVVVWGTAALFLTGRYLRLARRRYLGMAGLALGAALASKVSAISLIPPIGLLCLIGPRRYSWRRRLAGVVMGGILAGITLWAVYGFEVGFWHSLPFPIPAITHLKIYQALREHYQLGHPAFLLGQNGEHGWWYYFPVAFLLKTPLPTMILLGVAGIRAVRWGEDEWRSGETICRWGPMTIYPLLYLISSLFSSVNIGYRHLLPLLPFAYIAISQVVNWKWPPLGRLVLQAMLVWLLWGTVRLFPDYLAFFNALAGGAEGGYRYLVDSNLDWGQNLWQLRDWMDEQHVERVYYAHFSPARPQVYGIAVDYLPPDPRSAGVDFAPLNPPPGVYAIGATVLQGVYLADVNTYAWFRTHRPTAQLGYALFIYEVPSRPTPTWAVVCSSSASDEPVLTAEAVRSGLGRSDVRLVLPDCTQSRVYPAGGPAGLYVLPAGAEILPPGAVLEVAGRHADGAPWYTVYRLELDGQPPEQPESLVEVAIEGPLTFLGYRLDRATVLAGGTFDVYTFWRVEAVPERPLSLMAHLTNEDGAPITVGDGLGLPLSQWQPGDVFVQRHRLTVPVEVQGTYTLVTGIYWLDTMERWPVILPDGTSADQIVLAPVVVEP